MSIVSETRSKEFLKISSQFKLGALVTESSHPVTANLSDVARQDTAAALKLLFDADGDVVDTFREFARSGRAAAVAAAVRETVKNGGRVFFTGCGSTGRLSILLDSIWRDFWQQRGQADYENRTFSVMAGGDYALIKSVEGFEDFTAFGKKQMTDLNVGPRDTVFAITEGGETSFVIGTAWRGVEGGARVYFVYNNPDAILCEHVQRSHEVIQDSRIEKINLTTGPMSITGSTRMQATSIQLAVMLTILEMAAQDLVAGTTAGTAGVPARFLAALEELHTRLRAPELLASLAQIVALEESIYRSGHKNNYYADRFASDVLTDTTERSPTYCTPPFRKFDDANASESWSFLFLPEEGTEAAWENILKRKPRCVEWSPAETTGLVDPEKVERTLEIVRKISTKELMRFKIDRQGMAVRAHGRGDSAIAVVAKSERETARQFFHQQLGQARKNGARTGLISFGTAPDELKALVDLALSVPVPATDFLLDGVTRLAVKLVMNALSTCTMVRLGRVMGNYMIWVVPSNLKLIDRATRYITRLTSLDYETANALLFEILEYVEPRMKSDQAYPPVVGMAVLRARDGLSNEAAEAKLKAA